MSAPSIAGYNYKHDTARGSQYKTVEVCIKKIVLGMSEIQVDKSSDHWTVHLCTN